MACKSKYKMNPQKHKDTLVVLSVLAAQSTSEASNKLGIYLTNTSENFLFKVNRVSVFQRTTLAPYGEKKGARAVGDNSQLTLRKAQREVFNDATPLAQGVEVCLRPTVHRQDCSDSQLVLGTAQTKSKLKKDAGRPNLETTKFKRNGMRIAAIIYRTQIFQKFDHLKRKGTKQLDARQEKK